MLEAFWWGSVFLINVPIVLIALTATFFIAPPNIANPTKHWDFISSIYALFALSGLILGIKEMANTSRSAEVIVIAAVSFSVGAFCFARRQQKLDDPLLTFDIFRSRIFSGGVIGAAGSMFAMAGLEMTTTQKLQLADGFSPLEAGLAVAAVALSALPMSAIGGANLHRVGFLPLIVGGFTAIAGGTGIVIWATTVDYFPLLLAGMIFLGLGAGSVMSVASIAIIGAAPVHRTGMAASVEEVSYEFGALVSIAVVGSALPSVYSSLLPTELQEAGMGALYDERTQAVAADAFSSAYVTTASALAIISLIFIAVTAWCFRDNPRSGNAHAAHPVAASH